MDLLKKELKKLMNYQQEFYKTWQWISEKTQKLKRKVEKMNILNI